MVKFLIIFLSLLASPTLWSATNLKPKLTVYTYDSLVSKWGPGPSLKKDFENECHCELEWVAAADGPAVLARLRIEGHSTKADLVVGIDDLLTASADQTGLFEDINVAIGNSNLPVQSKLSSKFVPYDFGYYSFMIDTLAKQKSGLPFPRPKTMQELLSSDVFAKSIIIQDPRTSSVGMGLLAWFHALYGAKTTEKLKQLKNNVLTISKGWSEAYGLFTKGEAPIVFSYTTSEAYHREMEKTDRYQMLKFEEGHYVTIETVGLLKSSPNKDLAKSFIKFLLLDKSQAIIASKNWMYPAKSIDHGLPLSFAKIEKPSKILQLSPIDVMNNRADWIKEWTKALGN